MAEFDPKANEQRIEAYVGRALQGCARLVRALPLQKSSRDAPWMLDVEVDGEPRALVLRLDSRRIEHEFHVLRAMEALPIPTPRVYGWDPVGRALGQPCFLQDFVDGESLLGALLSGEPWAEALYIDTACEIQSITLEQLPTVADRLGRAESAADVLEDAYAYFRENPRPLADAAYTRLCAAMPRLPSVRFSNGDLWPDNLLVRDRQLVGLIDWANAGFSDPIYEFLLPFFLRPELRGRGIEERYCQRMGLDPNMLPWYGGLEILDSWRWVLLLAEPYEQHTADSLEADLARWLGVSP
jgi:aminoglycoside phosphotransferase (APT) family kinase protein